MSRAGVPFGQLFAPIAFLHNISIPFYLASKMWALANDPAAMKIFMGNRTSAARWTSMRFLSSFINYKPVVLPEGLQGARFFR
jgi:hypothetical protein